VEENQDKFKTNMLRSYGRIAIFELISTIKIGKIAKEELGLASSYEKASLSFLYHRIFARYPICL
jgi:hypothetical protein